MVGLIHNLLYCLDLCSLRRINRNTKMGGCASKWMAEGNTNQDNSIVFWNSLPNGLKLTESVNLFRKGLIAHLKRD